MMDMNDDDQKLKDALLQSLIEKMEDVLGEGMRPEQSDEVAMPDKTMSVEVAAPDKARLADGLDKAKEAVAHAPEMDDEDGDKSDAERLAELLGDEEDEDDARK